MVMPDEGLLSLQEEVEAWARSYGLEFPEIRYEVIGHEELNEIAAYGGFPVRYPHWRFGMEYDRLIKSHRYGLQKIYEMVINTRPVVAYLLRQNSWMEKKLVMAHVCGHADFFANNAWFAHTEGDMMDVMASHGTRIRALSERHGRDRVESFIEIIQSLDNLVDPGALHLGCGHPGNAPPLDQGATARDILGHLLARAPLTDWEEEVLEILREESYYFLPQILTKVINEGWASYWHSKLMTDGLLKDAEIVDYADQHSGAMGGEEGPKNPYKLGIELFRSIASSHAGDDEGCAEKLFEARSVHNDVTFLDNFLTVDFCRTHGLGTSDEEAEGARRVALNAFTNGGQPVIRRVSEEDGSGELVLEHCWNGEELQVNQAEETLRTLQKLWKRPVRLSSILEDRGLLLSCVDGDVTREMGDVLSNSP